MSEEKVPGGKVIRRDAIHKCPEPDARRFNVGDVFVCDCGQRHTLMDAQGYQGGPYWATQRQRPDQEKT